MHVYAGTNPVAGKPRRIREACPDDATAAATLGRLIAEVDQERFPDREATLGHALDKYIEVADLGGVHQGSARGLHPPHHQAGARPGQDPQAWRRPARRAVCRSIGTARSWQHETELAEWFNRRQDFHTLALSRAR